MECRMATPGWPHVLRALLIAGGLSAGAFVVLPQSAGAQHGGHRNAVAGSPPPAPRAMPPPPVPRAAPPPTTVTPSMPRMAAPSVVHGPPVLRSGPAMPPQAMHRPTGGAMQHMPLPATRPSAPPATRPTPPAPPHVAMPSRPAPVLAHRHRGPDRAGHSAHQRRPTSAAVTTAARPCRAARADAGSGTAEHLLCA